MRQKWASVWPALSNLPQSHLRVLDAGCGQGHWVFELAIRRPSWTVIGLDADQHALSHAEQRLKQLRLPNVSFEQSDFLDFPANPPYDVVLSVCSAHYLAQSGQGPELFRCMRSWLKRDGQLILLGPRHAAEAPYFTWLPVGSQQLVFTHQQLSALCTSNGFAINRLCGTVGRLGAVAKQLGWLNGRARAVGRIAYPLRWTFTKIDQTVPVRAANGTVFWLLVARSAPNSGSGDPLNQDRIGIQSSVRVVT